MRVDVRSSNISELRERVRQCQSDSALRWRTRERVADPGEDEDLRGVHLRHEEERDVACCSVHGRNCDDEANDANKDGGDDVEATLVLHVGVPDARH